MKKLYFIIIVMLLNSSSLFSQVAVNSDGSVPNPSAILDLKSDNKGFLPPRMTHSQLNTITNPADGLIVFCTDCGSNGLGSIAIFVADSWSILNVNCLNPLEPGTGTLVPGPYQIVWNWDAVPYATGYKWAIANNYDSAEDMGINTTKTETGLICNTEYTRYIWAYSNCGRSIATSLTQTTSLDPPAAPVSGTHISSKTQIVWNWNAVTGATGYKWNTSDDYNSATDMGTATTNTESGLTCNNSYTRYAWAYSLCGNSTPVALIQSTSACWTCGDPFTINHVAGNVAPVNKTVTYGTVTNIPGEPSKCWITSNLGADHQATAVNDATEASAGWYWQFNRQQGFKHDGTTRTPNTTWIGYISENSDWLPENDQCALLLGIGWRLPTSTEWTNVDASGDWTNWFGPWNSALKMHADGYLSASDGSLHNRGSLGNYWNSTQNDNSLGWNLDFGSTSCYMSLNTKAQCFSARCLRE